MCMAVSADGHLLVEFMLESLFLEFERGRGVRSSHQCFDLLVRNVGQSPIDHLIAVHPRNLYPDRIRRTGQQDPIACFAPSEDFGDSLFDRRPTIDRKHERATVQMRRGDEKHVLSDGYASMEAGFQVPRCVSVHPAVARAYGVVDAVEAFPTVMEVQLANQLPPDGGLHFIRIPFVNIPVKPITWKLVLEPRARGAQTDMLHQTFETLAPSVLIRRLFAGLVARSGDLSTPDSVARGAEAITHSILQEGFWSPARTCRIRDFRLAIATDQHCNLSWFQPVRRVKWWQEQMVGDYSDMPTRQASARTTAHCFGAGHAWFPEDDPEHVARLVSEYLTEIPCREDRTGFTPEEIAVGTQVSRVVRVAAALHALRNLGWVDSDPTGRYWNRTHKGAWGESPEERRALRVELARRFLADPAAEDPFDDNGFVLYYGVTGPALPAQESRKLVRSGDIYSRTQEREWSTRSWKSPATAIPGSHGALMARRPAAPSNASTSPSRKHRWRSSRGRPGRTPWTR